jgi:DNA-binding MarR family transcriptional regulator
MSAASSPSLGFLLRNAYAGLAEHVYGQLPARGFPEIRRAHSSLLRHVAPGGSRLTELAAAAGMAKQSMAYLAEDLTALGMLEAVPDPRDGRARLLRLTARGQALYDTLIALSGEAERRLEAQLGAQGLAALRHGLAETIARFPPGLG